MESQCHGHACAACKYQRRKCKPDCPLAPYFPPSSHRDFIAVHKLFGVSNILKTIRSFDSPAAKQASVNTMIFQAKARAADPVGGCHRIILILKNQILFYQNQLHLVRQHLLLHKLLASQFSHKLDADADEDDSVFAKGNHDSRQQPYGCDTDSLDKQAVTLGLSEDTKPLLGVFDDIFMDSKTRLLEDEEVEEEHKDTSTIK
ncbi:LOB domain-containing protein 22-like [Euphorbia lathyris]|uniref:LOB domain-containing protein 22-like n=1 Tax=Euphorbia lathyris TaxID=212925 RepID=UPI0033138430